MLEFLCPEKGEQVIKPPRETGILGNEFYARDIYREGATYNTVVPTMRRLPSGMVTLSEGAFDRKMVEIKYLTPASGRWEESPQNNLLLSATLYEELNLFEGFRNYFRERGGRGEVVVFQHYARGADEWVNPGNLDYIGSILMYLIKGGGYILDELPGDKAEEWLNDNLISGIWPFKWRNEVPFPGVFVEYLAGLDHEAHEEGMGRYRQFFKDRTDDEINDLVAWLKEYDEFDNKIFIITSDHGHTGMAEKVIDPDTGELVDAYADCSLDLKMQDKTKQLREKNLNNNLHIWELGNLLSKIEEKMDYGLWTMDNGLTKEYFSILTPSEIANTFKDVTSVTGKIDKANVIAALNGPMAHIYVKGNSGWSSAPDYGNIENLAEIFRLFMQVDDTKEAEVKFGLTEEEYQEIRGALPGLKKSIDAILVRAGTIYKVYTVENTGTGDAPNYVVELKELKDYFTDTTEYVDVENRINQMNEEKRSGDIVLIMKFKTDTATPEVDRYTTGVSCKSWHGSLNRSDSYVPFIVAYPGGNKYEIEGILKDNITGCNVDINDIWRCDYNYRLPEIIKKVIQKQYK